MIRLTDLKIKLAQGETKTIQDDNGLFLQIVGRANGTSYYLKHRCTFNGKRIVYTIKTTDLKEARKVALERQTKIINNINPDSKATPGSLKLGVLINEFLEIKGAKVSESTIHRITIMTEKYLKAFYDAPVQDLNAKYIYDNILKKLINEEKITTLLKLSNVIIGAYELGVINYPSEPIPNIKGVKQLLPKEQSTHLPSMTNGNLEDNLREIKKVVFISQNIIIHFVFELTLRLMLRPGETVSIKYKNIDFEDKVLYIEQTKTLKDGFRVPLSDSVIKILKYALSFKKNNDNEYLFEHRIHKYEHIHPESLNNLFKRSGFKGVQTAHGLRAIGRTWLSQQKDIRFEVAEACLSHFVGSNTVKAYLRTDYLEERRKVMQQYSDFIDSL